MNIILVITCSSKYIITPSWEAHWILHSRCFLQYMINQTQHMSSSWSSLDAIAWILIFNYTLKTLIFSQMCQPLRSSKELHLEHIWLDIEINLDGFIRYIQRPASILTRIRPWESNPRPRGNGRQRPMSTGYPESLTLDPVCTGVKKPVRAGCPERFPWTP